MAGNPYSNPLYDPNDSRTWFDVGATPPPAPPAPAVVDPSAPPPPPPPPAPAITAAPPVMDRTSTPVNESGIRPREPVALTPEEKAAVDHSTFGEGVTDAVGRLPLAKDAYQSFTDPQGFVNDILGRGGDGGKAAQTALAQQTVAPVNAQSQALYAEALRQAALATQYTGPQTVIAGTITAPEKLDPRAFTDTTQRTSYAYDARPGITSYQAALAAAADATNRMREAQTTDVARVAPAEVASIGTNINAPNLGEAAQTKRVGVDRVQVGDLAESLRGDEIAAAKAIAAGPSAAMSQFKAGQSQIVRDQLAMAERARGAERAGARREAIIAAGQQGATANLSAAALAATEEQNKRVAAASALSGIRAQDVGSATAAAGIRAQQANLQAQLDAAIAQGNSAAINEIRAKQAALEVDARKAEVAAALEQQRTKAGLATANLTAEQAKALADAAARNKAQADYAASVNEAARQASAGQTQVSVSNAGAQTKAASDYTASLNDAAQKYASAQTEVSNQNATRAAQQAESGLGRALTASTTNLTQDQATKAANVENALKAGTTTASNQLETEKTKLTGATSALTAGINAANTQADTAKTVVDANKAGSAADAQKDAALIGAGGAVLGALSDVRAKEDVKRISDADLMDLAKHMNAYTFRYKPGIEDGGEKVHASQMAQELEKARLGPLFVDKRADGMKTIDPIGLASVVAAAAASAMRKRGPAHA